MARPHQMLTVAQMVTFFFVLWNLKVRQRFHKIPPLDHVLSEIYSPPSHAIYLPKIQGEYKLSERFQVFNKNQAVYRNETYTIGRRT
jgi:hypothetical protein